MSERAAVTAYIGLGANLGDRLEALKQALQGLRGMPGSCAVRASRPYRSAPVDAGGPDYLNAVVQLSTTLTAPDLLLALQALENAAGRQRRYRNAPRTLDLDLLLYGDGRIESTSLCVPHPRMQERAFVLRPLAELAPEWTQAAAQPALADQSTEPLSQLLG
jgi:2-amino-4-hydroxy-6-hydroxymethyldihydropteridine diphosphokinase